MTNESTQSETRGKASKADRPDKPYPDFPLYPHPTGYWAKKIRGELHYFGRWGRRRNGQMERVEGDGWQEALDEFLEKKDDLYAGRTPRVKGEGLSVADLCNRFLTVKSRLRDNGEISPRTFEGYKSTTDRIVRVFGKKRLVVDLAADDFGVLRSDIAKTRGAVALGNEIQRVRTVFKFGYDEGLIDRPVRYGQQFKKPSKTTLRKARAKNGERMLESKPLRELIESASPQLKAMILLGLNCGMGNTDCALVPQSALDLDDGWLTYPREKTGVARRAAMWPETVEALGAVIAGRPKPRQKADADLVFLTKYGHRWVKTNAKGTPADAISQEFRKLLNETGHHRPGIGFYVLRHVFRTIADETRDFPAVRLIMGHTDSSIDDVYRERIGDDRLRAVADHVHAWLFPPKERKPKQSGGTKRSKANKNNPNRISGRMAPVLIEYTSAGQRVSKQFDDAFEARRFFAAKDKQGAGPKVLKAEDDRPQLRVVG